MCRRRILLRCHKVSRMIRIQGRRAGTHHELPSQFPGSTDCFSSVPGLGSVPALYSSIKGELGLIDPDWGSYPSEWRSLSALWLRVDAALAKTGRGDLTIVEINSMSIPGNVKDWLMSKKMSRDAHPPDSGFGKVWTDFLANLPVSKWAKKPCILQEQWCRPGKTGVVLFLLGIHWQAKYSATGNDWNRNVERIQQIFNIILTDPTLCVTQICSFTMLFTIIIIGNAQSADGKTISHPEALRRSSGSRICLLRSLVLYTRCGLRSTHSPNIPICYLEM